MTKILVTGAAGFSGSHVAEILLEKDHQALGLDDCSARYDFTLNLKAKFKIAKVESVS
jgi:nucleoside-diphosphate-sugar epimerase